MVGVAPDSKPVTFNGTGTYYWQAVYSGDSNNNGKTSACTDESMTVTPKSPKVTTQVADSTVGLGHAIQDVATFTDGHQLDGQSNVTFDIYGPQADPNSPVCTNGGDGVGGNRVATVKG